MPPKLHNLATDVQRTLADPAAPSGGMPLVLARADVVVAWGIHLWGVGWEADDAGLRSTCLAVLDKLDLACPEGSIVAQRSLDEARKRAAVRLKRWAPTEDEDEFVRRAMDILDILVAADNGYSGAWIARVGRAASLESVLGDALTARDGRFTLAWRNRLLNRLARIHAVSSTSPADRPLRDVPLQDWLTGWH